MKSFEPKIVCFSCNFGWGYLTDPEVRGMRIRDWVPVVCSGKIDATHILKAFRKGADGVLILGCVDGDCHFQDGNYQTRKKVQLLQRILPSFGIDPRRVRMELSLDPEGNTIPKIIEDMNRTLRPMGPLGLQERSEKHVGVK